VDPAPGLWGMGSSLGPTWRAAWKAAGWVPEAGDQSLCSRLKRVMVVACFLQEPSAAVRQTSSHCHMGVGVGVRRGAWPFVGSGLLRAVAGIRQDPGLWAGP
jgi:hypothetical protein